MLQMDLQRFLFKALTQDTTCGWFWDMVYLATNKLSMYSGPRDEADYYRIMAVDMYSKEYKYFSKVLLDLYESLQDKHTKKCLRWFLVVAPLMLPQHQKSCLARCANFNEIECCEIILDEINKFTNPKLKYDLLTLVINRIKPMDLSQERNLAIYNVATFLRSRCVYAQKSNDPKIQETLLQDLHEFILFTNPSTTKLDCAERMREIMLNRLENVILKADTDVERKIMDTCLTARQYAALAGPDNQAFIDQTKKEFDYKSIINLPAIIENKLAQTK